MSKLRGWLLRLGELFQRDRRERELAAEMESNLALHIEENLRAGMSVTAARREALMRLGALNRLRKTIGPSAGFRFLKPCSRTCDLPVGCS